MFRVSPAVVLSGHGHGFSLENYRDALPRIRRLSFVAFQLEIFAATAFPEWLRGSRRLQETAADLGLNIDTGHAWVCQELVPLLPFELQERVFGTHLGDNRSADNVKMLLGQGTIPWAPV
jgi:sugar phosphate isomerase/epimerase